MTDRLVPNGPASPGGSQADPFRYGWRYVRRKLPDGREELEQVPLTLEDVLHPQEEDVIPQKSQHEMECAHLAAVLRARPAPEPILRVTVDCLIDWGVQGVRNHSPDVAVFVGLEHEPDLTEGTFHLGPSGGRCLLVFENVSPHTRENDVVHKVREYHQAGVPLYILVDQEREDGPRRLRVFVDAPGQYEEAALDAQGRLLLPEFAVFLSLRDNWLVLHDAENGRELGDYAQVSRALDAADQRNLEMEHVLEVTIEATRKETKARLEAERVAEEQAKARQTAEERIRELEAALRRLQAQPPE
jgi:Uma2 family endonuclease